ncbi:hypothetical protein E6W39_04120 [Kitasatospora acidiphila]|uniref:ARG and Rhodanese-Phosphatase-superfamily-associated domain-containing protein n=1 Tax=Kitasatospora acidiphila TaxID=2567942 RepID=A0A540VXU2_9ACTN|nr:hypothetical protein [Kitasatospora acidiphila]TQF01576.1 hypothetical protein E6W39_04120 [Kitasatospora acidiphila]
MTRLTLTGLTPGPAQVWGAVRLVPLLREQPITDLRLHRRLFPGQELGVAQLGGRSEYFSYVPHAFVADWTNDGSSAAAYGTQLTPPKPDLPSLPAMRLRMHRRLARREGPGRLRFLPQHLALEGYLALHFGGPTIAWSEWSQRAMRGGLSPRAEEAYLGSEVRGLADALRVFEIHPGQCGMLLYLADALAAAFVVPHPADYRALHPSLLQDLYGELVHHYATLMPPVTEFRARIPGPGITGLADLRAAAEQQAQHWRTAHDALLAAGLLDAEYTAHRVYRMGPFTLSRLLPPLLPKQENHIGETITDGDGRLAYLKTFRLSEKLVRRAHLLSRLAAHDWHLGRTAADLGLTPAQLGLRLESAGFGLLLRQDILDGYRKAARRG